jgi:hypothetical protein
MRTVIPSEQKQKCIEKSIKIHGELYDFSDFVYVSYMVHGRLKCKACGCKFEQSMHKHLTKHRGCPSCGNIKKGQTYQNKIKTAFFDICNKVHNNFYSYDKSVYENARSKLIITCPIHGDFIETAYEHKQGHGCPSCNMSRLENDIEILLKNNQILFERYKKFDWLINPKTMRKLEVDFYLPNHNIVIECQGKQHFQSVEHFGGESEYEKVKVRDYIKHNICKEKRLEILYYTKNEYINKNVISSYLYKNNIFSNKDELLNNIRIKKDRIL